MRATIRRYLDALERGRQFAMHDIWMIGRPGEKVPQGFIIKQIRVVILLITNIADGSVLLRASALTFATILSIVPFFAVMFYVIQTFNLGEEVYDAVQRRMELTVSKASELIPDFGDDQPAELAQIEVELPGSMMGIAVPVPPSLAAVEAQVEEDPGSEDESAALRDSRNVELQNKLLESMFLDLGGSEDEDYINPVERLAALADDAARNKSGVSIAGITLLFTTVFGLMRNIEKSFNSIWGVRRTRSWYRAFSDYIMITLMLPFVATAVLGISAAMQSEQVLEQLGPLAFGVRGMQYSLVVLIFTSLYFVVPSTRVKWQYALLGGIVAGLLWVMLSWAYVSFQIGVTRYNLVFSTFAQFPVLLMWIYASWVILLFGAELSYAYQNEKTFALERLASGASYAYREALGVRAMIEIGRRFEDGEGGLELSTAAGEWNVPSRLMNETLQNLEEAGLVRPCAGEQVAYQPARPLSRISAQDIVHALREVGTDPSLFREDETYAPVFADLDHSKASFEQATLEELVARIRTKTPTEPTVDAARPDIRLL